MAIGVWYSSVAVGGVSCIMVVHVVDDKCVFPFYCRKVVWFGVWIFWSHCGLCVAEMDQVNWRVMAYAKKKR